MKISQKTIATKANNNSITQYMEMSSIEPQSKRAAEREKFTTSKMYRGLFYLLANICSSNRFLKNHNLSLLIPSI